MAAYLVLLRYTEKGMAEIKATPDQVNALKQAFRDKGAEIKELYALLGRYDAAIIAEAPNDETVAGLALALGSKGGVHTETLRAFTMDEVRQILASIS